MLGWVITCHDELAQEMLDRLETKVWSAGPVPGGAITGAISAVNMLSRMMCDALHATDSGDGVIFLTDKTGAAPYRAAGADESQTYPLRSDFRRSAIHSLSEMYLQRGTLSSVAPFARRSSARAGRW